MNRDTIAIIGGRIAAHLAAGYLRKRFPDADIVVIGRRDTAPPLVGESTIEGSTVFIREAGFAELLDQHFHKFGLTFYFKMTEDPSDRRYSIHEETAIPPLPAALINRFDFDRDARALNTKRGVRYIDGVVTDIDIEAGNHTLTYREHDEGADRTMTVQWVIDASGRNQFLARRLKLKRRQEKQRSAFWFRLTGFDRSILTGLNAEMRERYPCMREQMAYDPYLVTHHFMGRGNWVWCIPVATTDDTEMISIGITMRPDIYGEPVTSVESFMEKVSEEHPVLTDLVGSGQVHDTNVLRNYMYYTDQQHSEDGWFIIGDAANAVDPLYSSGLMLVGILVTQAAELIATSRGHRPCPERVRAFNELYSTLYHRSQGIITDHYEVMEDPYQSPRRMHWLTTLYFYFILPWFMSGYHADLVGARLMRRLMLDAKEGEDSAWPLFEKAGAILQPDEPDQITNYYSDTINYRLLTAKESELPRHLSRLLFILARIRYDSLRTANFWDAPRQVAALGKDVGTGLLLRSAFRNRSLRNSRVFQRMMGVG